MIEKKMLVVGRQGDLMAKLYKDMLAQEGVGVEVEVLGTDSLVEARGYLKNKPVAVMVVRGELPPKSHRLEEKPLSTMPLVKEVKERFPETTIIGCSCIPQKKSEFWENGGHIWIDEGGEKYREVVNIVAQILKGNLIRVT